MVEKILTEIQRLKSELKGYSAQEGLDYIEAYINAIRQKPQGLDEAALRTYPKMSVVSEPHGIIPADNKSHLLGDGNADKREGFKAGAKFGYEQAEKDLINKAEKWILDNIRDYVDSIGEYPLIRMLEDFRKAISE